MPTNGGSRVFQGHRGQALTVRSRPPHLGQLASRARRSVGPARPRARWCSGGRCVRPRMEAGANGLSRNGLSRGSRRTRSTVCGVKTSKPSEGAVAFAHSLETNSGTDAETAASAPTGSETHAGSSAAEERNASLLYKVEMQGNAVARGGSSHSLAGSKNGLALCRAGPFSQSSG